MNHKISLTITYKDFLAKAKEEGIKLTPKRAKELMSEWARGMQFILSQTANELISDCVLPDVENGE